MQNTDLCPRTAHDKSYILINHITIYHWRHCCCCLLPHTRPFFEKEWSTVDYWLLLLTADAHALMSQMPTLWCRRCPRTDVADAQLMLLRKRKNEHFIVKVHCKSQQRLLPNPFCKFLYWPDDQLWSYLQDMNVHILLF